MGRMFLVTVGAHLKWIEADIIDTATSTGTIRKLCHKFATHGIPETIVTMVLTSKEFQQFVQLNGIRYIQEFIIKRYYELLVYRILPGLGERTIQTLKIGLKKMTIGTLDDQLSRFLFQYYLTPHSTTGISLAELLLEGSLFSP